MIDFNSDRLSMPRCYATGMVATITSEVMVDFRPVNKIRAWQIQQHPLGRRFGLGDKRAD